MSNRPLTDGEKKRVRQEIEEAEKDIKWLREAIRLKKQFIEKGTEFPETIQIKEGR